LRRAFRVELNMEEAAQRELMGPSGELTGASSFRVIFMPKQAGSTEVQFTIQPRAINPLFMPVTFFVTINP
jgi:hypothetical protein